MGIFSIGTVVFLCIALFVVTLAKLFLTFVIAIGPLFILCLAWRPTARFFDSWLSMVLNAVVLTWFAFFALGLSAYMGAAMFKAISRRRWLPGRHLQRVGRSHALLRAHDPHGHHLLPGTQPGLGPHWRCRRSAGHSDDPERHDGFWPALCSSARRQRRCGSRWRHPLRRRSATRGRRCRWHHRPPASAMARRGYGAARSAAYKLAAQRGRS